MAHQIFRRLSSFCPNDYIMASVIGRSNSHVTMSSYLKFQNKVETFFLHRNLHLLKI